MGDEDIGDPGEDAAAPLAVDIGPGAAGLRLDKALADLVPAELALSRSRLAGLIGEGRVRLESAPGTAQTVAAPAAKVKAGERYLIDLPDTEPAEPEPEAIPLAVVHEDAHLIVVDKPAGMVVHPAPGAPSGTLVNALLHHCAGSLAGIGGARRPGIVHRIDKDTSGLIVAAKTDAAHQGLAARFAVHDIERAYLALCHGVPDRGDPRLGGLPGVGFEPDGAIRIETLLDRHPADRKRMAVRRDRGRRAVTRLRVLERLGDAALLECRLETGRTHQIRVHAAHLGHGLIGDPVYGGRRGGALPDEAAAFPRQALHAARLGFRHPASGENMAFESALPPDMEALLAALRRAD